ncbi:MurR/RpiR family transcriptional regulator [Candidatus Enterococcus willemsii]|uniref:HTH rpiR-type domain-containing protein n=1 Tax=Candidatus Enterococcus willemsii TaxID=1857215 RepID=A0ABQ6YY61_9ENTE|nr:MurR/RpiR family transcriptional regulator [Enterococcus sp. CU12B]KAF1303010.1 hypothetical protein BAU17_07720 [Enterococcus sp. CU12B]
MDPITKLYSYFNTENSQSTYYKLTEFVLENVKRLPELSISDFAEATFVSKATITRFIHFIGFENYHEFKKYFRRLNSNSRLSFLKLTNHEVNQIKDFPADFLQQYTQQIIQAIQDTAQTMNLEEIDLLVQAVNKAEHVAFLGYSDSNIIAKDIQLGCLAIGKKIEVAESSEKFSDIVTRFSEQDLIVILSNYGNFFNHYQSFYDLLLTKNIPLVLVTQNYSSMDSFRFQQTIYLTTKRQLNIGNYPMRIFSEYFVRRMMFYENTTF